MSDLQQRTLQALRSASAAADRNVRGAAEDARALANLLKSGQLQTSNAGQPFKDGMAQLNTGIAETAGGLVDMLNPFDEPHSLNPFKGGTGSAVNALRSGMEAAGVHTTDEAPEGLLENFMRGTGQAAASLVPATVGAGALSKAGGTLGNLSDDVAKALLTKRGALAETAAGGISRAAEGLAEEAGAAEWVQNTVAVAAPMSIPAAGGLAKGAVKISPAATLARRVKSAVTPYTQGGATEVAHDRMVSLAGGPERAEELASRISSDNPLNLTPAQQTADPNMLAVQRLAAEQDPNIRVAIEERGTESARLASDAISTGGSVTDAQEFFQRNRVAFKADLQRRADEALESARAEIRGFSGARAESGNSRMVVEAVRGKLDEALAQERALWANVPRGALVGTTSAQRAAQSLVDATPFAQRGDIPRAVSDLLENPDVYGEQATVAELYGLYSELRRVSRSAMAGTDQNKNKARIANEVAEAILEDLGANASSSVVGQKINEARAFSAALHETFDQGAPGRILKRSLDGDTAIEPEAALARTVGRGGVDGMVASTQLETAGGGQANKAITDYLTSRFADSATKAGTGEVSLTGARSWFSKNKELLSQYPELREELAGAIRNQESAEQLAQRVTRRISTLETARRSSVERFTGAQAEKAVHAITNAQNPVQAARRIAAEARRDTSGKALDGVKAAFSDYLITEATRAGTGLDASSLQRVLNDPQFAKAMGVVFEPAEVSRMKRIATELQKAQTNSAANIGTELSGAKASAMIEWVARVFAARQGAKMGGGDGGSLQTANMASARVKGLLNNLAKDKASQMLADAVTNPELFRALLLRGSAPDLEAKVIPRFLPYLVGAVASGDPEQ